MVQRASRSTTRFGPFSLSRLDPSLCNPFLLLINIISANFLIFSTGLIERTDRFTMSDNSSESTVTESIHTPDTLSMASLALEEINVDNEHLDAPENTLTSIVHDVAKLREAFKNHLLRETKVLEMNKEQAQTLRTLKDHVKGLESALAGMNAVVGFEYEQNLIARRRLFEYYISKKHGSDKADKTVLSRWDRTIQCCIAFQGVTAPNDRDYNRREDEPLIKYGNILADREMAKMWKGKIYDYADLFPSIYGISFDSVDSFAANRDMLTILNIRGSLSFGNLKLQSTDRAALVYLIMDATFLFKRVPSSGPLTPTLQNFMAKVCAIDLTEPINNETIGRQLDVAQSCEEHAELKNLVK